MGSFSDTIKLTIDVVTGNARSGFASLKSEVASTEGAFNKMKTAGKGSLDLVKSNALLAVGGVGALATGMVSLANKASDLGETISASRIIFGTASSAVESFGDSAAQSLGMSKQAAVEAASTFGTFGKSAGLAGTDLAQFSTKMVGLAGDLASFKNTSPAEAIEAIGAALRGESEPIRKYGVLLDDAKLKQRAMTLGIYDGEGALSAQQKVLAAQAEILAQTGDAQGDFARTSDSLANKQRILAAEFENAAAKLGQALIPAVSELVTVASQAVGPLSTLTQKLAELNKVSKPPEDKPLGWLDLPEHVIKKPLDLKGNWDLFMRSFNESLGKGAANVNASLAPELLQEWADSARDGATAMDALGGAAEGVGAKAASTKGEVDALKAVVEGLRTESDTAKAAADGLADSLDEVFGSATDLQGAADATRQNFDDLTQSVKDNGATLDENTEKGRANREQIRDNVKGIQEYIGTLAQSGATSDEVAAQYAFMRQGLVNQLVQFGMTEGAANDYINTLGLTPHNVTTAVILNNKEQSKAAVLDYLNNSINRVPANVVTYLRGLLERGEFDAALRVIASIPRNITVNINPKYGQGTTPLPNSPGQGFAMGTQDAPGGWAKVGERGEEIVELPKGAVVHTAGETQLMLNGAGGGQSRGGTAVVPAAAATAAVMNLALHVHLASSGGGRSGSVHDGHRVANDLMSWIRTGGAAQIRRELGL